MSSHPSNELTSFNTLRLGHSCRSIELVRDIPSIINALRAYPDSIILGGGSNVLISRDLDVSVIVIDNKGIEIINENEASVRVKVAAGEDWHDMVLWSLEHSYGGLENLSLIPGKCGAAPIQNIGAYGVEISDVLQEVHLIDRQNLEHRVVFAEECELGYRDSVFKHELKDQVVITHIVIKLDKPGYHNLRLSYGAIQKELSETDVEEITIQDVSNAVVKIRQSKLPDPLELPNVGSFFKNPIIGKSEYDQLIKTQPDMPSYPVDQDHIKVPAAWLIDKCGLKGYRIGEVGTHVNQALVIVNYGTKDGLEILRFAQYIQREVLRGFGIQITPEVNIIS